MREMRSVPFVLGCVCVMWALVLGGCMAQQADLKQTEKSLQQKIRQSNEELAQTRAKQSAEITSLRDQELPQLRGELERALHKAQELQSKQDDLEQRSAALKQQTAKLEQLAGKLDAENATRYAQVRESLNAQDVKNKSDRDQLRADVNTRLEDINRQMETLRKDIIEAVQRTNSAVVKNVDQRLDEQRKALAETQKAISDSQMRTEQLPAKFAQFSQSLAGFKESIAALSERLNQEEQTTKAFIAKYEADSKSSATHINESTKSVTTHLNEVNKSVAAVAQKLAARMDEQVGEVNSNVTTVAQKLTARYDEQLNQVNANLNTVSQNLTGRLNDQDRRIEALGKMVEQAVQEVRLQGNGKMVPLQPPAKAIQRSSASGSDGSPGPESERAATVLAAVPDAPPPSHAPDPVVIPEPREEAPKPAVSRPTERPDKAEYERLLAVFREGDLEGARRGFAAFLNQYPNSDLAPNARYWLGESHYGKKDYKQAIDAYDRVELDYPQSEKVPAAILKKGYAYLALKDKKRASSAFKQVVTLYPKSLEAGKAYDKLAQLKESR
ncbi:MAG TPA: tol-pal system protein YbgF [Nitrospira sp.]|nr:tol-pal system protein YbgF [Nitrospira sp.]